MFFLIMGIISVLAGCFVVYARNDRIKNAKPREAKLIAMEEKTVLRSGIIRKMYRAEIIYKGDSFEQRAHHHEFVYYSDHIERFGLGEEFIVYVDPRISDIFYFPQEMKGKVSFGALAFLMIGAFFIFVGIIIASRGM